MGIKMSTVLKRNVLTSNINRVVFLGMVCCLILLAVGMSTTELVAAAGAGNPMENLGNWLLKGVKTLIIAGGVIFGGFNLIKGATVKGLIVLLLTGVIVALILAPSAFGTIGGWLLSAIGI